MKAVKYSSVKETEMLRRCTPKGVHPTLDESQCRTQRHLKTSI